MVYRSNTPNIHPVWEETGPEEDMKQRLMAHMRVSGLDMHLEAVEVENVDGFTVPKWDAYKDQIATLESMNECAFQTTEIGGRTYVIIATPYGE